MGRNSLTVKYPQLLDVDYLQSTPPSVVAQQCRCNRASITKYKKLLGIKRPCGKKASYSIALDLAQSVLTERELAIINGYSQSTINSILRKYKLKKTRALPQNTLCKINYPKLRDLDWLVSVASDRFSLAEIGNLAGGASRERVRQILKLYHITKPRKILTNNG